MSENINQRKTKGFKNSDEESLREPKTSKSEKIEKSLTPKQRIEI